MTVPSEASDRVADAIAAASRAMMPASGVLETIAAAEAARRTQMEKVLASIPTFSLPAAAFAPPPPVAIRSFEGDAIAMRSLSEATRRKAEREGRVAAATIGTQELMAVMVEAISGQSQSIETLTKETVTLRKWTIGLATLTAVLVAIGVVTLLVTVL